MKSLLKDTMIYGISTVLGKFLNWTLTFLYVRVLLTSQFGKMTNIYAYTALAMIILTYGMETAFFRFVNKEKNPENVYSTTISIISLSSLLFVGLVYLFLNDISVLLQVPLHSEYVMIMAIVVAMDAFMSIPLAYLRYQSKAWTFFAVRMTFIGVTIIFTFISLYLLPKLYPDLAKNGAILSLDNRLMWIFIINLMANIVQFIMLMPYIMKARFRIDRSLLSKMLKYSLPILLLGLAGSFNNQADKIIFPRMFDDPNYGDSQLGIYSAAYKLALIMVLFTQAFRYAYDPFIFSQSKNKSEDDSKRAYSLSMRYYILTTLIIFVGVMSVVDLLKYFLSPAYYDGLVVLPYVMAGQLMFGVYFNLSVWYKLTDRTIYGAILSIISCSITVLIIVLFAREYGFITAAWASFISNAVIMMLSYLLGQKYYPIDYKLSRIALYIFISITAYLLLVLVDNYLENYCLISSKILIFVIYLSIMAKIELPKGWTKNIDKIKSKLPFLRK